MLHSFAGGSWGDEPYGTLIASGGTLYGTASIGGSRGWGIVFSVTPSDSFSVIYNFYGNPDGATPKGSLVELNGNFYGTTFSGGGSTGCLNAGCGSVFELTKSGSERILHGFVGGTDGTEPNDLTVLNGALYGTTQGGGGFKGYGVAFKETP